MTPTQKQAMEMARDYIAERPEDRKISAGKVVAALTAALAEQADDKAVNMAPLSDEQISRGRIDLPYDVEDSPEPWAFREGVRFAERAHGIKGD